MHSGIPMEPAIQRGMDDTQIGPRLRTGHHLRIERRSSSGRPDSDHPLGFDHLDSDRCLGPRLHRWRIVCLNQRILLKTGPKDGSIDKSRGRVWVALRDVYNLGIARC